MKKFKTKIYYLAIYQLLGGIVGIIFLVYTVITLDHFSTNLIIPFLFFCYSIICGYLLEREKYQIGLRLSFYNNLIQIIGFRLGGITFFVVSGIIGSITLDLTNDTFLGLYFWVSYFDISLSSNTDIIFISVNLIAIGIVILIWKLQKQFLKLSEQLVLDV